MALTPSAMLPLGTKAPDFSLPDVVSGKTVTLQNFSGKKGLMVMFICRHCPYVQHIKEGLAKLGRDYAPGRSHAGEEIGIVAISANDAANYPDDSPAGLKEFANEMKFNFSFLYDETQGTAHAYSAACTPDFFLFDADRKLAYRGQMDDSRPGNGKPVPSDQKASIGCNIKWKKGNEPATFKR